MAACTGGWRRARAGGGGGGGGGAQQSDCVRACVVVRVRGWFCGGGWWGGVCFVVVVAACVGVAGAPAGGGGGPAWAAAATSRRVWVGAWRAVRLRRGRVLCSSASVGGGRVAPTTWRGGGVQHHQGVRRVAWDGVGSAVVVSAAGCGRAGGRAGVRACCSDGTSSLTHSLPDRQQLVLRAVSALPAHLLEQQERWGETHQEDGSREPEHGLVRNVGVLEQQPSADHSHNGSDEAKNPLNITHKRRRRRRQRQQQ